MLESDELRSAVLDILKEKLSVPHKIKIKIENGDSEEDFPIPTKGTTFSAGYDVRAISDFELRSDRPTVVPLGFSTEIPIGLAAAIFPRSGQGVKEGLQLTNTIGLIDSDYRNEWFCTAHLNQFPDLIKNAVVLDDGTKVLKINRGERFAQFVFLPIPDTELVIDSNHSASDRKGGYGSTGIL